MTETTSTSIVGHRTAMDCKKRVCRAMNFISRNLGQDLSLDEISAAAAFSRFHFHRIFKAVVGETVAGFARRLNAWEDAFAWLIDSGLECDDQPCSLLRALP